MARDIALISLLWLSGASVTVTAANTAPVASGMASLPMVPQGAQSYVVPGEYVGNLFYNNFSDTADIARTNGLFATRKYLPIIINKNKLAFAALKNDGSGVTWGHPDYGGDSSGVAGKLASGLVKIFSTSYAFAALKNDGSVVT